MAKIKVLDKHMAELIAAGEVVERPASIVKELVENSIDAGASQVTVEIRNGGISYLRVTDNGHGIDRDDVPVAFLRHATSKVSKIDDLENISSLGFRGEALASISAVSHLQLLTKTSSQQIGTRAELSAGEIKEIEDAGCPMGTTFVIRDLFYNVPARMKFLKKDVSEANAISGILDKIALSHPETSIKLIREGKVTLHTPGDSKMLSAVYAVFGKEFTETLVPVKYELNGIKVHGFVSKPINARPNRAMQNFFINGRYVKTLTAAAAINEAYKGSIVVGKFPACVLHIDMNFNSVDVNVHPAKLEVRFTNEKPIFEAVYHAVKSAISKDTQKKEFVFAPKKVELAPKEPAKLPVQTKLIEETPQVMPQIRPQFKPIKNDIEPLVLNEREIIKSYDLPTTKLEKVLDTPVIIKEEVKQKNYEPIEKIEEKPIIKNIVEEVFTKFIGEAFNTYIIAQYGKDSLLVIDKHAAHERLIYENLKEKASESYAQTLLSPISVVLDTNSYTALLTNADKLSKMGFEIEDFGASTVLVRACPIDLDEEIEDAIIEIAAYISQNRVDINTEHMNWIYHNIACRAAIKGGNKSSDEELIALAKLLEENEHIRYCPHGRPISILIKKKDLEKQFNRI